MGEGAHFLSTFLSESSSRRGAGGGAGGGDVLGRRSCLTRNSVQTVHQCARLLSAKSVQRGVLVSSESAFAYFRPSILSVSYTHLTLPTKRIV